MALFGAILISRNDGCLNLLSFFLFMGDCYKNKKYIDLIKINEEEISFFIEKIRNIYNKLSKNKVISSYYSELDNIIYIYDENYIDVIKKYIDYFMEASSFVNEYYDYEENITYGNYNYYDEKVFSRVIS